MTETWLGMPPTVLLTLVGMIGGGAMAVIGVIIWMVKLDTRVVAALERLAAIERVAVSQVQDITTRLVRVEALMETVREAVKRIERVHTNGSGDDR